MFFRSIWKQRGNFNSIHAAVPLYRMLQLVVFVSCPFTSKLIRPVGSRIQVIMPSTRTLSFRSIRHHCGNFIPIIAAVHSYRIFQLVIFIGGPFTGARSRRARIQGNMHCFFVRLGTIIAAIPVQFLPPCICTASFSLPSSSTDSPCTDRRPVGTGGVQNVQNIVPSA
jgi:hypothetical protein